MSAARKDEWLRLQLKREQMEAEVRALARQMNALTDPGRLPVELLAEVFANVGAYRPGQRTSDHVLRMSHVCRHWREVALRFPHLWAHLELGRKREYHLMVVERSRNCSLYVSGNARLCEDSDIQFLLDEMHRVYSLELSGSLFIAVQGQVKRLVTGLLPAPRLEIFSETSYSKPVGAYNSFSLFSYLDMPRLREIHLDNLDDGMHDSLVRQSSSHLRILEVQRKHSRYDTCKLLAALERAPLLKELTIRDPYRYSDEHLETRVNQPVLLSQLESLTLEGVLETTTPFLRQISTPDLSAADIVLDTGGRRVLESLSREQLIDAALTVVSAAASVWKRAGALPFELSLGESFGNGELTGSAAKATNSGTSCQAKNRFIITLDPPLVPLVLPETIAQLEVRRLVIRPKWNDPDYDITMFAVFGGLIEELTFQSAELSLIVSVLSQDPLPFPQLRAINLVHCTSCHVFGHAIGFFYSRDGCKCEHILADFVALLHQRRSLQVPIQELSISDSLANSVDEELRKMFSAAVAKVSIHRTPRRYP
ncbi:F-box protein [Phanerochaete sordida]|uniref:F-box protein n=1 Tax=Phanerochaete sordida TaxID=48140 RepID=A0A9P3GE88_9APHY|nr:F-box protein [Phanerochaete sordida]